jgi:hypothetical protein
MKTVRGWILFGAIAVAGVSLLLSNAGCDSADGTNGLSVTPSSVTLSVSGSGSNSTAQLSQVFTATSVGSLAMPFEWSVANPALGTIASQSGSNALYVANAGQKGENIVTVKDQYGNEGFAAVHQE